MFPRHTRSASPIVFVQTFIIFIFPLIKVVLRIKSCKAGEIWRVGPGLCSYLRCKKKKKITRPPAGGAIPEANAFWSITHTLYVVQQATPISTSIFFHKTAKTTFSNTYLEFCPIFCILAWILFI